MKIQPKKKFEQELREKLRIKLVECLINQTMNEFTQHEQTILSQSLLYNKNFVELREENKVPVIKQRQILEGAIYKMSKSLENAYKNAATYIKYRKEIMDFEETQSKEKRVETIKKNMTAKTKLILDKHLQNLPFSSRVKNIFESNKLIRVADLLRYNAVSFTKYRNIGNKAVNEIETYFKANNLWWGMLE